MPKTHAAIDDAQIPRGTGLCRFPVVDTTLDLDAVDCALCKRRVARGERPFVRTVVERSPEDIERHRTATRVERDPGKPPWASERHALRELVEHEDAGPRSKSASDPDRFNPVSGGSAHPDGDIGQRHAAHVAPAAHARSQAFEGPWRTDTGQLIPVAVCQTILEWRVAGRPDRRALRGHPAGDIRAERGTAIVERHACTSERMSEILADHHGLHVRPQTVERIARYGRQRMRQWLRGRRLIPTETVTTMDEHGETVERPWDLEGWKEIAAFIGCSERKAQQLAKLDEDPMPIHYSRIHRGPVASRAELAEWLKRQVPSMGKAG